LERLLCYGEILITRGLEEVVKLVVDIDILIGFASNEIIEADSKLKSV